MRCMFLKRLRCTEVVFGHNEDYTVVKVENFPENWAQNNAHSLVMLQAATLLSSS